MKKYFLSTRGEYLTFEWTKEIQLCTENFPKTSEVQKSLGFWSLHLLRPLLLFFQIKLYCDHVDYTQHGIT